MRPPVRDKSFIEAVYVYSLEGKELGGGRWTDGDPFGKTGTLTYRIKIDGDQVHQFFRFRIVTDSTSKTVAFECKGIFGSGPPTSVEAI